MPPRTLNFVHRWALTYKKGQHIPALGAYKKSVSHLFFMLWQAASQGDSCQYSRVFIWAVLHECGSPEWPYPAQVGVCQAQPLRPPHSPLRPPSLQHLLNHQRRSTRTITWTCSIFSWAGPCAPLSLSVLQVSLSCGGRVVCSKYYVCVQGCARACRWSFESRCRAVPQYPPSR